MGHENEPQFIDVLLVKYQRDEENNCIPLVEGLKKAQMDPRVLQIIYNIGGITHLDPRIPIPVSTGMNSQETFAVEDIWVKLYCTPKPFINQ